MAKMITELQKLGLDAVNPALKYNDVSGDDAIRNILKESVGGEWNYYNYIDNRGKFFQIISELIQLPVEQTLEGVFDGVVNTSSIAMDDVRVINVADNRLFDVAVIARGNADIRRQRIFENRVTVETEVLGVKIYEDFDRFVTGKINWATLVSRVRASIQAKVAEMVYNAVQSGYDLSLNPTFSKSGTFDEGTLDDLIATVEGITGLKCGIYGTKKALGKISASLVSGTRFNSDGKKDEYADFGYLRNYKGTPMMEIKTPVDRKGNAKIDTDELFILPMGEDIIDVCFKGAPFVSEDTTGTRRNDKQIEFLIEQQVGVTVLIAKWYGIYKLQ